jgi:hypothetical protein
LVPEGPAARVDAAALEELMRRAVATTGAPSPGAEALPTPAAAVETPQARKAALLTRLRAMKAEGLSSQQIAMQLNREGIPTLSGRGSWQKGTVANLLAEAAGTSY